MAGILSIFKSGEIYKLRKYRIYRSLFYDYKRDPLHFFRTWSIHRKGFTTTDWDVSGLDNKDYRTYLTSRQYNKYHPINGYYSKIIDDKMVIKYVLNGTDLAKHMPDYWYLIDEFGMVQHMMDSSKNGDAQPGFSDILKLLKEKGALAVKLITGTIGKGFYKFEYCDGKYYVSGKEKTEQELLAFMRTLRNYVISEYLKPHPETAKYWPYTPNTIRYLVGNVNGEWRMLKSYLRIGTKQSGAVENFGRGGVLCYANEEGKYERGYMMKTKGKRKVTVSIDRHPETGLLLKGTIPCWGDMVEAAMGICRLLPQTRYLGFDFVITEDGGVKLLEINSLTSLDTIQLDGSILESENGKWFFSSLRES